MELIQVAMSVPDIARQTRFYGKVLGFRRASAICVWGEGVARAQGLPGEACFTLQWMVGTQYYMQFEFFQYSIPTPHPRPSDWRPNDLGYVRIGVVTPDFDGAIRRAVAAGHRPLTEPVFRDGLRRVCLIDPAGVIVELMENGLTLVGGSPARCWPVEPGIKYATASVPDLAAARRYFVDGLGLVPDETSVLHGPEDEALWGLKGAQCKRLLLRSRDSFVELVQYTDPLGKPWRQGHLLSDIGILNLAVGCSRAEGFFAVYDRLCAMGCRATVEVPEEARCGDRAVTYFTDDRGFSMEIVLLDRRYHHLFGFEPEDALLTGASEA